MSFANAQENAFQCILNGRGRACKAKIFAPFPMRRGVLTQLVGRMRQAFSEANLRASVGHAQRDPHRDLSDAQRLADRRMLLNKESRR